MLALEDHEHFFILGGLMTLSFIHLLKEHKTLVVILTCVLLLLVVLLMWLVKRKRLAVPTSRSEQIHRITVVGIFTALSTVLYYFVKFPLPFFPSFLDVQFSNLPVLIIGFMFGPVEGITVAVLRTFLKIPATSTACVGELVDMFISILVVVASSFYYQHNRTKKGAIISLCLGCIAWIVGSVLVNWVISVPFYTAFYFDGNVDGFIQMLSVIPNVNQENYIWKYLLISVIPFNTLLSVVVSIITFIVYKHISILFRYKKDEIKEPKEQE